MLESSLSARHEGIDILETELKLTS